MASAASNLPTTTTTTTTTTTARPFTTATKATKSPARPQTPQPSSTTFPIYHLYPSQTIPIRSQSQNSNPTSSQQQQQGIIYPVASSGRGFMVRPSDQTANNPNFNPGASHPRAVGVSYRPVIGSPGSTHHHHHHLQHHHPAYHLMRQHPTHLQHHQHYTPLPPIKGIPVTGPLKAASSSLPVSDSNGYKNTRDRSRDDNAVMIRDRKVKISDGASLYALCRSWLRNGFLEENQAHYGDFVKVLPRPLPESDVDVHSPRKEGEKEVEEYEEDVECIDNLSAQDLFRIHVKRAKRVRARLRERRLKRIARYKTRKSAKGGSEKK
ncbi:uncharacterized protein LOC8289296 isoform X2 [Ricinus communis]|uniref:uncharacterized protein LOC8289296 isoform X2 n=1 Tax=Ricinus communis TaxID=3988 RepID=UPI0007728F4D|nr:uncharacterized protein LOC8289296 isoform X2 [Ricinus communis]|eukprot:XP_015584631.1 uncharacterized protein LOC8289296 isoform X2 [Ricinus communis]